MVYEIKTLKVHLLKIFLCGSSVSWVTSVRLESGTSKRIGSLSSSKEKEGAFKISRVSSGLRRFNLP